MTIKTITELATWVSLYDFETNYPKIRDFFSVPKDANIVDWVDGEDFNHIDEYIDADPNGEFPDTYIVMGAEDGESMTLWRIDE